MSETAQAVEDAAAVHAPEPRRESTRREVAMNAKLSFTCVAAALTAAVAGLIAALPEGAAAAAATRETSKSLFLVCGGTTAQGARAEMELSTGPSRLEADVRLFAPGAGVEDPPVVSSDAEQSTGTVNWTGNDMAGSVPVFDYSSGAPRGDATFALTARLGDPIGPEEGRFRNGNQVIREAAMFFPLTATGTLTLPDGPTVALTSCYGTVIEKTVFHNNPQAEISLSDVSQVFCDLDGPDGRRLIVDVDAATVGLVEFAPGADPDVDPPLLFGLAEDGAFTRRSLTATAPVFAPGAEEPSFVGEALVGSAVIAGPPTTRFERSHRSYLRIRTWSLTFTGAVTMPDGARYSMADCTGHREVIQRQSA